MIRVKKRGLLVRAFLHFVCIFFQGSAEFLVRRPLFLGCLFLDASLLLDLRDIRGQHPCYCDHVCFTCVAFKGGAVVS